MVLSLITGITGFAGSHLAEHLLKEGHEVFGLVRWRSPLTNIHHIKDKIRLVEGDLLDMGSLFHMLKEARPDYIFHLAAQSYVVSSWKKPYKTLHVNTLGQLNLFEAVRALDINPIIQIGCSSEEYGRVYEDEVPIKETNPLRPLSPYGVSKVAQDLMGYQYFQTYGMKIVRTRAFNHTGPRRGHVFVTSNFAKQIVDIEKGTQQPTIFVGDLSSKRDFTDVRDTVRGYLLAVQKGKPGDVYNICSNRTYAIQEVLDSLLKLTTVKVSIRQDPSRMRPSDVRILHGDNTKFKDETGWEPQIPFEQTLKDILEYWRQHG